jgi:hypothetical protein
VVRLENCRFFKNPMNISGMISTIWHCVWHLVWAIWHCVRNS